ncbi:ATP-dependent RNA helicase CshB [Melghiribacillus thermohalophilus]|uniref:ATP-dependent RNA helicase CshB n=1 Tax=Melghiribacillus thermohalophilus TaxID=1324956 RepID=A0A4R3NC05_9BACI|nr:DEAD/DEAH box helicase [Melghiribacillus thermohalophilus]TCT26994.1 ATP-dependent RNA helicase CshB [Melghiribacillus thermohalophilus]
MSKNRFQSYALKPDILDIIHKLKFKEPTPIQQRVIPAALRGESLIGQSHTGSGKTHSYLIPIFNDLESSKEEIQYVITTPTRELAVQIYDEVRKMIQLADKENEWRAKLVIGGTDKQKIAEKLKRPPQMIVGTPGRILDLVKDEAMDVFTARALVMDEADLMIDLDLIQEVDQILLRMKPDIQLMVFSATIPEKLKPFLKKYMENPSYISIDDQGPAPEKLEHRLIPLRHRRVSDLIEEISGLINPYLALIFVNKKDHADELAEQLMEQGLETGVIHGGLSPRERKRILKELKNLRYQYIVATDLAARGIDIPGVSHVINAEMPKDPEFYIHRAGRTARAGLEGTTISFYTDEDIPVIQKLEKSGITFTNIDIKDGEWVQAKAWNQRNTRQKKENELDEKAWNMVKKPKKVKPGYKKKMKRQAENIKKKLKHNKNRRKK